MIPTPPRRPAATAAAAVLLTAILALAFRDRTRAGEPADPRVLAQLEASFAKHRTAADWEARRAELRAGFLRGAGLPPLSTKRSPPPALVHGRREHDGYSVENVALETFPGFYATGNLYRPLGRKGPFPAVLCPHGHFKPLGRFRPEHQIRCAHLARQGVVVLSHGMVGWQDSEQTAHDDPLVLALQTWNSIRAADYLENLADVDPKRLASTGASGGGTQALFHAFLDERLQAVAPAVIVYPWSWFSRSACRCENGLPVLKEPETNAIEIAACIAPRRQLLISCGLLTEGSTTLDPTHDFPAVGMPFIQEMYRRHSHPERVRNVHLPLEPHDFGPSKRKAVYAFLAEALGFEDRPEDLAAIAIEPPAALAVFDAAHPLPPNALRGSEAVAQGFRRLSEPPR